MNDAAVQREWFGQPRGLSTLFFTELWERLSYYGMRAILVLFMVDAIETHNGQNKREANRAAMELARDMGLPGTGGSDAHQVSHLGACVTVFSEDISTEDDLIRQLRAGSFRGAYLTDIAEDRSATRAGIPASEGPQGPRMRYNDS